jgi:DNA-binding MarR family transcriptional regulator
LLLQSGIVPDFASIEHNLTQHSGRIILSLELFVKEHNSRTTMMKETSVTLPNRIEWLRDLIGLEIVLWDRINARLKAHHDLSLAFFESLYFIGRSPGGSVRVGDLARALRITVGATSKLVDRVEAAGLIRRELDTDDRRASRVALTEVGRQKRADASTTYETEMAAVLDATLNTDEQQRLHDLVTRMLTAIENGEVK